MSHAEEYVVQELVRVQRENRRMGDEIEGLREVLRHVAASAKHPSPTVNTAAYLGQVAESALGEGRPT